jgi:hypothetical protein
MDSARHCHDQAAECHRLMKKAQSKMRLGLWRIFPKAGYDLRARSTATTRSCANKAALSGDGAAAAPQKKAAAGGWVLRRLLPCTKPQLRPHCGLVTSARPSADPILADGGPNTRAIHFET